MFDDKMNAEEEKEYSSPDPKFQISEEKEEQAESVPTPAIKKKKFWAFVKSQTVRNAKGIATMARKVKEGVETNATAKKAAFEALQPEEKARIIGEQRRIYDGRKRVVSGALRSFGLNEEEEGERKETKPNSNNPFDSMFGGGKEKHDGTARDYSIASPPTYSFGINPVRQPKGKGKGHVRNIQRQVTNPLDSMFSTPRPTRGIKPPRSGVAGEDYFAKMGIGNIKKGAKNIKGRKVKSWTFKSATKQNRI